VFDRGSNWWAAMGLPVLGGWWGGDGEFGDSVCLLF
jgi:hypothetical protein